MMTTRAALISTPSALGATAGSGSEQLVALLVIVREAAKREPVKQLDALEFQPRAFANIAGAEADSEPGCMARRDRLMHAGVHAIPRGRRFGDLAPEMRHIRSQQGIDGAFRHRLAGGLQAQAHDRRVGHPIEPEMCTGIDAVMELPKRELDRATSHASGCDERAVDVEQNDGGSAHGARLLKRWVTRSAHAGSSSRQ